MQPSLKNVIQGAHRNGATVTRFRISAEDAKRVREAEKGGGHSEGLRVLLEILFRPKS